MEILDYKAKSDEEILAISIEKPTVFEIIVERYQKPFLRAAGNVMKDQETAEDIVQEAFTKIYFNATRFKKREGASFKSWAYKILFNTSFSYYNKAKKGSVVRIERSFYENIGDSRASDLEKYELRDLVASTISRIPKNLGKMLFLHYIKDLSQKDIAQQEGVTVSAIKTRVHRAKKKARDEFKKLSLVL